MQAPITKEWVTLPTRFATPGNAIEFARSNVGSRWRVLDGAQTHSTGCGKKIQTTKARTAAEKGYPE